MLTIRPPWTPEQVEALNRHQKDPRLHPFTCGSGRRTDEHHKDGQGILVATADGWVCPWCDYRQFWAHEEMLTISDTLDSFGAKRV